MDRRAFIAGISATLACAEKEAEAMIASGKPLKLGEHFVLECTVRLCPESHKQIQRFAKEAGIKILVLDPALRIARDE